MSPSKTTLEDLAAALSQPPPTQSREIKAGDPQVAAGVQYLSLFKDLSQEDCIVDLGAGEGLLATLMTQAWSAGDRLPRYVAVDLPDPLSKLSMPLAVHNNSEKVEFADFFERRCAELRERIRLVVIRNVFHELNIQETAFVIVSLNNLLIPSTRIYIQDLATLQPPERGNVAWSRERFTAFLHDIGFSPTGTQLESYGGTDWFFTDFVTSAAPLDEARVAEACSGQRRLQKMELHEKARALGPPYGDRGTVVDDLRANLEISFLDLQLEAFAATKVPAEERVTSRSLSGFEIPIRPVSADRAALLCADEASVRAATGVIGGLRNKEELDIPQLILNSRSTVWFWGYSLRKTFALPDNQRALSVAVASGVDLKFLVADPTGVAAALRGRQPAYSHAEELVNDILATIDDYESLTDEAPWPAHKQEGRIALRTTISPPPCSFFIIDDLAFVSLYSHHVTGSSAPCLVFGKIPEGSLGYYELLRGEFQEAFRAAADVGKGSL
jgi:hypothetical protein